MKYPHLNFPQDWSLTAGLGFGAKTSYGYHEGLDINDKGGGDSDLGKPIYAEADGIIDFIHNHTAQNTFGNHYALAIGGAWGIRYLHHAHCLEIYVKANEKVKEGQLLARIGKSGTVYAHDHWACARVTPLDNVANTEEELNRLWEDPVIFVEKWKNVIIDDMPPYLKGLFNEIGLDFNNESRVREFFQQAKEFPQVKKDLENAKIANNQQAQIINQLNKDIEKVMKDFKAYKEQIESTPVVPAPVIDPLPQSSLADLVKSILKKLGF